jgi:hypothetical protein
MESSLRAIIPLAAALSKQAQVGHIFDGLQGSLISIGQLCDDCVALFSKYHVDIIKDGKIIIKGKRNTTNGLWNIPLAPKIRDKSLDLHKAATPCQQHDPKQTNEKRARRFPTWLRLLQPIHINFPSCHTTRPLLLLARTQQIPHHKTSSQVGRH